MAEIAAILLAAGRASRFAAAGGREATKLVAPLAGKPVVRHVAEAALASRARPIVVVTGHARLSVEEALAGLPLRFVDNPGFASGLASSLRTGLAALPDDAAGALVLLGDMPAVESPLIDRLILAFEARPDALAVAPTLQGQRGNPVLLSRALFAAIADLKGDEGARRMLAALPGERILEIGIEDEAASLDVDTPQALAAARRAMEGRPKRP